MTKVKACLTTIICGISTFVILPNTNYFRHVPPNANSITNKAWQMTAASMKTAFEKVGVKVNE